MHIQSLADRNMEYSRLNLFDQSNANSNQHIEKLKDTMAANPI